MRLDDWQAVKFSQNGLRFLILILVIPLFFFFLIVSVSLTHTLPSALLHLFLAPDHLGDSFPVKTKYSKIHLNKITQSKVLNFLFLERKTTNPKTYFEVNEFLFFLFFKAVFKKSNSSYDFPIALLK